MGEALGWQFLVEANTLQTAMAFFLAHYERFHCAAKNAEEQGK